MIRAAIFDLDGTLVQTEKLKSISYARAIQELCRNQISIEEGQEAFKEVVGLSRQEVAAALVKRFDLAGKANARLQEFQVEFPWQALVHLRLQYYDRMLADPQVLRDNQWAHNVGILKLARMNDCKTALATMSHATQVDFVLDTIGLRQEFDVILSRDDVEHSKPDPEIYLLAARLLDVQPEECFVLEDSPAGVRAAVSAGMHVVAVSTPFTRRALHEQNVVDPKWIVDEPGELLRVVQEFINIPRIS